MLADLHDGIARQIAVCLLHILENGDERIARGVRITIEDQVNVGRYHGISYNMVRLVGETRSPWHGGLFSNDGKTEEGSARPGTPRRSAKSRATSVPVTITTRLTHRSVALIASGSSSVHSVTFTSGKSRRPQRKCGFSRKGRPDLHMVLRGRPACGSRVSACMMRLYTVLDGKKGSWHTPYAVRPAAPAAVLSEKLIARADGTRSVPAAL